MAVEFKEIIMQIRKGVTSFIRISYKSACAHPYISGLLFLLLILYRVFPSVSAFLISYSPVIVCTAILLGTLLSYGTPNIPEIEEEIKRAQEISSLQMGSAMDDVILKKDENCEVEIHLEKDMAVNEIAIEKAAGEASNSSTSEIEKDVTCAKSHDEEQDEIENRDFSIENQAEIAVKLDSYVHNVAVNDRKEREGLRVQIAKPLSDSPFDSSLGSPWQPVDKLNPSSDFDSDGDESSSTDASMTDIIPMLDELHPLLDSELPQPTLRASDHTDSSSSSSSQDHESDDEVKNEELKEKDDKKEESVPWTEDDQKNVMDLGYSEEERNQRLENLIAKRRLRKLQSQRYEIERNLIHFDSFYPSIPPISAPRRNPFDIIHETDSSLPGSAPSVLQPRQNPFDLPHDQVEEVTTLSKEFLDHNDFISAAQRERLSRFHESSIGGPSFLGDSGREKNGSKLNPFFFAERSELIHPEIRQESPTMSPISIDFTTIDMEEIHQDASNFGEEIGKGEDNLPASDSEKLEMIEERCEDSDSSSFDKNEKISGVDITEESADLQQENPVYNSDPSAKGRPRTDIAALDGALLYEGRENTFSNPLPSDAQDLSEVASPPKPFETPAEEIGDGDGGAIHNPEQRTMKFSTLLEKKSEHEYSSQSDLGNTKNKVTYEILSKQEGEFPKNSDESDKESDDKVHAEIHESLLSELDAVSDFSVETKLKSNVLRSNVDTVIEDSGSKIQDSGISSIKNAGIGSSEREMTVYNPKLHFLEACSTDELDSIFKLHHEEAHLIENSVTSETEKGLSDHKPIETNTELQFLEANSVEAISSALKNLCEDLGESSISHSETREIKPEEINSELPVLEAKSVEDITSAPKNHSEGPIETNISQSETSEINPEEINSDLHVLEAKSVEDISLALKNLSEGLGETSISQSETLEIQPERPHLEPEEIDSDLHVLETKSLEDVNLALKQVSGVTAENFSEQMKHEDQHIENEASRGQLA